MSHVYDKKHTWINDATTRIETPLPQPSDNLQAALVQHCREFEATVNVDTVFVGILRSGQYETAPGIPNAKILGLMLHTLYT